MGRAKGWTEHGILLPFSEESQNNPPPAIADCGGFGRCIPCSLEAEAVFKRKMRKAHLLEGVSPSFKSELVELISKYSDPTKASRYDFRLAHFLAGSVAIYHAARLRRVEINQRASMSERELRRKK